MIQNIRHLGIVVRDLSKSSRLYENIFGLVEISRGKLSQFEVLKLIGIYQSEITWIKLGCNNVEEKTLIELFFIENKEVRDFYYEFMKNNDFLNFSHISFTVDNIWDIYKVLEMEKDIGIICKPSIDDTGKNELFFIRDYDDNLIELVEIINE